MVDKTHQIEHTNKTSQKTIYFSACGIGLGHVGRLKPFARELHEKGHRIYFTGYGESLEQLNEDTFRVHAVPEIEFYENADGSFNSVRTSILAPYLVARFMRQVKNEFGYISKYKPDLVVCDTRYSTLFAAKKYKFGYAPKMPILFITNQMSAILPTPRQLKGISGLERVSSYLNIRIIGMADHVLVQDLPPPFTISTTEYQPPEWLKYRFQYIGFIIRRQPEDLPERKTLREKLGVGDEPLIFAPLAGPIVAREQLMHQLREGLKDFDGTVVITMGMFGNKVDKRYGNVLVKGWLKNRFEMLKAADLTIARPGLATIGDFLRYGVPSILVPTLNHPEQRYNATSVENLGVGRLLDQDQLTKNALSSAIYELLDDRSVRKNVKKIQNIMIEHNGLQKVRSIISSKINDR